MSAYRRKEIVPYLSTQVHMDQKPQHKSSYTEPYRTENWLEHNSTEDNFLNITSVAMTPRSTINENS